MPKPRIPYGRNLPPALAQTESLNPLAELATLATEAINSTPRNPRVVLIMPGERRGETQALCKSGHPFGYSQGSPVGRVINETEAGAWVSFDAVDLLAFCVAHGAARLQI